ncbi:Atg6/Beclin [Carpediemonas membranifera]|uniref:Atg6/Beclin n=1 Tax=Carpediemonas membranifera TaxID=201153 RepID=A0A8J6ASU7_9EUKA|nr:Atg6/Beclin [Carpediemonas membranifera]|eukprot:KAG9393631.1 Atg6/Beclin [Carpediemonas membranifera]
MEFTCISCGNPLSESDLELSINLGSAASMEEDVDLSGDESPPFALDAIDDSETMNFYSTMCTNEPMTESSTEAMPLCERCFESLAGSIILDIQRTTRETGRYNEAIDQLSTVTPPPPPDLTALELEESQAMAEFQSVQAELHKLRRTLAEVRAEAEKTTADTEERWRAMNEAQREADAACEAARLHAAVSTNLSTMLASLREDATLALFPIVDCSTHATICGITLSSNDWAETSAALGVVAFLISVLQKKLDIFGQFTVSPQGPQSTIAIERQGKSAQVYPLHMARPTKKGAVQLGMACCCLLHTIAEVYVAQFPDDDAVSFERDGHSVDLDERSESAESRRPIDAINGLSVVPEPRALGPVVAGGATLPGPGLP